MWSTILLYMRRLFIRNKIKKETKGATVKQAKRILKAAKGPVQDSNKRGKLNKLKKLVIKDKTLTWSLRINLIIVLITVIVTIMMISSVIMFIGNLAGWSILSNREEAAIAEDEESNWTWDIDSDNELGDDFSTGGIYPKDPQLKQTAKFFEILEKSCDLVNDEFGEIRVSPESVLAVFIRETGGKILNDLVKNTSINPYTDLAYENPICGKVNGCLWIKNGYSHFIGGSVSDGKDMGDPAHMQINTSSDLYDRFETSGGHAIGYGQFEVLYVDSYLIKVYPIGDYADKTYNNSTDRYKEDSQLGFIRPNIAYIPDILYSTAYSIGGNLWSDGSEAWNKLKNQSWFSSLSEKEQAFCYSAFRQMGYVGGYVDSDTLDIVSATLKMLWGLKADGKIDSICDALPYLRTVYPDISNNLGVGYSNNLISRPSNNPVTDLFNAVIKDGTFGSNTSEAASELQALLKSETGDDTFGYYVTNHFTWIRAIPGAIGWQLLAEEVAAKAYANIEAAEKETEGTISNAEGNYIEYVGSGHFNNPSNSEYYAPDLKAIWYSQGSSYKGGKQVFGYTLPAYTTTIQGKPFAGATFNKYGCTGYAAAALLSNMCGMTILPDQLPGTTGASGILYGSHDVDKLGVGTVSFANVIIPVMNEYLDSIGAGYTLKTKLLKQSELAECEQYLYDWLDAGAMLYFRVIDVKESTRDKSGDHQVVIAGYDKASEKNGYYDLRILNSIIGTNIYTLTDINKGQGASADTVSEGLHTHTHNMQSGSGYCCTIVWRSDTADSLPGL